MNKVFILILAVLAFGFMFFGTNQPSKFELHAKISEIAHANDLTYPQAEAYCMESLLAGHDCVINK